MEVKKIGRQILLLSAMISIALVYIFYERMSTKNYSTQLLLIN